MAMVFHKVMVVGANRGIGAEVAKHLKSQTEELITVSRTPANRGR